MEKQGRSHRKIGKWAGALIGIACFAFVAGCHQTYPENKVAEDIAAICEKEYNIHHVQVKTAGTTLGVFLPLSQLFDINPNDLLALSQTQSLESLLQPSEEALKQVEDVLFSTSRVLLSTDKKIDFYVLQATDMEATGFQIALTGYVDDIKRVRLWDIPRSEYRKRVLHEFELNRPAIWSKPVRGFFESLGKKNTNDILAAFFAEGLQQGEITFPVRTLLSDAERKRNLSYEFLDIRSEMIRRGEVFVYVKLREFYEPKPEDHDPFPYPSGTMLEYIFVVRSLAATEHVITRVIPFYYFDVNGTFQKVAFPEELGLEKNLNAWEPIFDVYAIALGDFLASQVTRRAEILLGSDERIFNTFASLKLNIDYQVPEDKTSPYFTLSMSMEPKHSEGQAGGPEWFNEEDVVYMLNAVVKEFVAVLRAYHFDDFANFTLVNAASPSLEKVIEKSNLELFRRGKVDIYNLLRPGPSSL